MSESGNAEQTAVTQSIAVDEIVLIILVMLSLVGVGITHFSPSESFMYWLAMIFVFGIAAMIAGWAQAKEQGHVRGHLLKELFFLQSLHWLGSLLTVLCIFAMLQSGRMSAETAGLVILLILGLATFLDGIRIGWRYSLAGVYLGVTAMVAVLVKNYVPILILVGMTIVAATIYWEKQRIVRQKS
ncbi:MAG: hypothetical protein EPN21_11945 [Methylococcaceae bacterium]|nr:MAG: hypothetical protein EPN21_11945 [Methylococcaceae bacterium]